MIEVYDRPWANRKTGKLHSAFNISEDLKINSVSYLDFSLPYDDPKNELCLPFHYVRYNNGDFYRIMPSELNLDEKGNKRYKCEHVLAMLIDSVMFGQHVVGNIGVFTRNVIEWILDKQNKRFDPWAGNWVTDTSKAINWRLGRCDFNRQFEYGWEQETLLSALFSVPNFFTENYMWTFDTRNYPFTLNLERLNENINPQMYIRLGKNLLRLTQKSDPTTICTRIYPLGEGEGVNQLNIRRVNNNIPFLQSPQRFLDEYGIVERVWIDRRYTDEQSLRDAAAAMLHEMQEPLEEYETDFALIGTDEMYDVPALGKVVEIVGENGKAIKKTFITGIKFIHDELPESILQIANKPKNIAGTVTDMMDRQRIEIAYAQGATTFFERDAQGNCDPNIALTMKFLIPADLKIINFVRLDVEMGSFRTPFTVTGGGGGRIIDQMNTTSSGASSSTTTQGGGGFNNTTRDGGGTTSSSPRNARTESSGPSSRATTESGGRLNEHLVSGGIAGSGGGSGFETVNTQGPSVGVTHTHPFVRVRLDHRHMFSLPVHSHNMPHTHSVPVGDHNHTITDHSHRVVIDAHSHNMPHNHDINHTHTIPDHTHNLTPGVRFQGNPTTFSIIIDNVLMRTVNARTFNGDISQFLVNAQNRIPRNRYYRIEILPNDPAHVLMTVSVQGFVQSRGNTTM